jgi:hypothetical protein
LDCSRLICLDAQIDQSCGRIWVRIVGVVEKVEEISRKPQFDVFREVKMLKDG